VPINTGIAAANSKNPNPPRQHRRRQMTTLTGLPVGQQRPAVAEGKRINSLCRL
jgi:hypothetical protein